MPRTKNWIIAQKAPPDHLRRYRGMSSVIAQILFNRGLTDPTDAYNFLYADDDGAGRFLTLKRKNKDSSIDRALARVFRAIRSGEPIAIYGDFDADGVTSTVLLVETLKALGAKVMPYIPHRIDEGYGVNNDALLKLARDGVKLVITVDCGIRSIDEIEEGKAYGLEIIVTDHHSLGPEVPAAYAVINPKRDDCQYTEDMLAGVGVAYRLAEALLTVANGQSRNGKSPPLTPDDLVDLVAIGTVADLAPLNRIENRVLVKRGLEAIRQGKRPGLRALIEVAGTKSGVSAQTIGYSIGPRINAAGRLDTAMTAYQLLTTRDENEAALLANRLQTLNTKRQELTREAQELIRERVADADGVPLIFASDRNFQPGIVGLVAGRLAEEFFRPTVVMEEGDSESRASCRSIPQFDITRALDECAALLVRHGGHAQAAGFTVLNENVEALKAKLTSIAETVLDGQTLTPTLEIDLELDASQVSLELATELLKLEPTGHLNPSPALLTRNLRVLEWRTVGREDQHLKLRLGRPGLTPLDAIGFNMAVDWAGHLGDYVDLVYQLEINEWNNHRTAQLHLLDLKRSGS